MKRGFTLNSSQQNEKREIWQLVNEAITPKITHKHGCGRRRGNSRDWAWISGIHPIHFKSMNLSQLILLRRRRHYIILTASIAPLLRLKHSVSGDSKHPSAPWTFHLLCFNRPQFRQFSTFCTDLCQSPVECFTASSFFNLGLTLLNHCELNSRHSVLFPQDI